MTSGSRYRLPALRGTARAWQDEPLKTVALRARLQPPDRHRRFAEFGRASILHKPAWVYGPHKVSIGEGCILLTDLWLAVERQAWHQAEPVLRLAHRVAVRLWCTASAAVSITIEDDVVMSACATVVDSEHTFRGGNPNTLYSPVDAAQVRFGRGALIGADSVVLAGTDVGEHCIVCAGSVVEDTIPDYSVAVGAPARVVGSTTDRGAGPFASEPAT